MSEYKLDIPGDINLSDYSSIHDYMGLIKRNDKFTITSKMKDPEEMKILCKMLENNYFDVVNKEILKMESIILHPKRKNKVDIIIYE